jgi:hypothetical protein
LYTDLQRAKNAIFSFHVSLEQPLNTSARELKEISKSSKAFPRVKLKMSTQAEEN